MNISVTIPVKIGGYTGQRDQWESHTDDYKVELDKSEELGVTVKLTNRRQEVIWLPLLELTSAVEFLNENSE